MSFEINVDQERNESDLELEVMDITVQSVLNLGDPFLIKASEVIIKLLRKNSICLVVSEIDQIVNAVNIGSFHCKDWLDSWKVFLS